MALAGLKKQINKANQNILSNSSGYCVMVNTMECILYVSEKMGAVEGTKLTEEYLDMERKTDATIELVDELLNRTKEYLQPNPATRAKLMLSSKVATSRAHAYAQPEGTLGEAMIKYSKKLGEVSAFAQSLNEMGEALKEMAETKYALEDNVKQNFLEPLTHLQTKDVKDVVHHRKKLESRRLDFDGKRRKKNVTDDEIKLAEDKFEESFNLASAGMFNLLQNETEQISQMAALSEALFEYHSQCASILESLTSRLMDQTYRKRMAAEKPMENYIPKKLDELQIATPAEDHLTTDSIGYNGSHKFKINSSTTHLFNASPLPSPVRSPARTPVNRGPCCQALYDFDAENPKELAFKEGDIITLNQKLDDNWFEGTLNGKTGMFPISYVQILVPLGH
ncbi:lysophosphatidic acid acyltransferase endophilin-like protein [Leptotrombidium deliense]|uniref:Endophilin-A n=1 Tax=Leptotrombidium deliense TaxID=299467 RepID=A0A443SEA4_9ACAR|nr:lysophosphatidic acid acyltransferase endophilin-like protein [Leptotrombidium deliense]